jgi:hypothetical protein
MSVDNGEGSINLQEWGAILLPQAQEPFLHP